MDRRQFLTAAASLAALGPQQREGGSMLVDNPQGNFRFLRGIAPYSSGAVAMAGYEVAHVTLSPALPYRKGFEAIDRFLAARKRPSQALCGIELRSPRPFTFPGFVQFNEGYIEELRRRDILLGDGNPVARTNVGPEVRPPAEVLLYAFSYTTQAADAPAPTCVVAGAGELAGERLDARDIVRRGDVSPVGLTEKARQVLDLMDARLRGVGVGWEQVTAVEVYTVHDIFPLLRPLLLTRAGAAAVHGLRWHFARPPIEEIEFEMDVRASRTELFWGG